MLEAIVVFGSMSRPEVTLGMDFHIYLDRTRAWLAGSGFYLPEQLEGPYWVDPTLTPITYPPVLLYVLVPFMLLPSLLWWAIPIGVIGYSLLRLRPPLWTWPVLAAVLVYPRTWMVLVYGNPSLWAMAALTAGLVWRWPLAFVPIKPTLAPFALLGVWERTFWKGVGLALVLSLPFGAMWLDYLAAMANARSNDVVYLLGEWPIIAAPVIAWFGASRFSLRHWARSVVVRPSHRVGQQDPGPSVVGEPKPI
jgi:hypothetical protein